MNNEENYIIAAAREWLLDCFSDDQHDEITDAPAARIRKITDKMYDGGWSAFVANERHAHEHALRA